MDENHVKLAEEFKAITEPAFALKALLLGIHALLEGEEITSPVWAARQLIEQALELPEKFYGNRAYGFSRRLEEIDQREVHHG